MQIKLSIPLSVEYAIREAVKLLRLSRRNFRSKQVAQAAELLEMVLRDLPERHPKPIEATARVEEP
ncbi:MAG TPA: hypothetical protein PKN47_01845 [Nitrospira sp.]|nr:hypothetical protein [Nitrospira sp.]